MCLMLDRGKAEGPADPADSESNSKHVSRELQPRPGGGGGGIIVV